MNRLTGLLIGAVWTVSVVQAESVSVPSVTGDELMIHQLRNGEIWGSLLITDQVPDEFSEAELIVMQIDHNKPIKLDQEKRCNTPAGKAQTVDYRFTIEKTGQHWLFDKTLSAQTRPDFMKVAGWDGAQFYHMKSDRRPHVVDFPIRAALALDTLWSQFIHGQQVVFHYTTDAGEARQARFVITPYQGQIQALSARH